MKNLTITSVSKAPIVSREAYRAFASFMFAAAMIAWGGTLLGTKPFLSGFPQGWHLVGGILYGAVLISFYWLYSENLAASALSLIN